MRNIRFLQNQSCKQRHKTTRSATLPVSHAASQGHSVSHTTSQSCSVTRPLDQSHYQSVMQCHKATRSATQPVNYTASQSHSVSHTTSQPCSVTSHSVSHTESQSQSVSDTSSQPVSKSGIRQSVGVKASISTSNPVSSLPSYVVEHQSSRTHRGKSATHLIAEYHCGRFQSTPLGKLCTDARA